MQECYRVENPQRKWIVTRVMVTYGLFTMARLPKNPGCFNCTFRQTGSTKCQTLDHSSHARYTASRIKKTE